MRRLLLIAAAGGLLSCKGAEKQKESNVVGQPTGSQATAKEGPQKHGGYIVIPSREPEFMNPVLETSFNRAMPLVFEGLMGVDAKGELVPMLAQSFTRLDGGKTLVFNLRRDATWHDGQPFTADDVIFTVEQIRKPNVETLWRGYLSAVDKIEATDPHTVTVHFPTAYGPDLAIFTFGIIPKHVYDGPDLTKSPANHQPVGTGPFKFVRWEPGKEMVLAANATYWHGRPYLDQVEIPFVPSRADEFKLLKDDKLDFAEITQPEDWSGEAATPEFRERFEMANLDENVLRMIAWNCLKKPFDDKRVRQAMAMALDRPRVIEDVLKGAARPASGPFYPGLGGADPNVQPWPFDTDKAAALLDEAGLKPAKNGIRFSIHLLVENDLTGPAWLETLAIFRSGLSKIGVDLQTQEMSSQALSDALNLKQFDAALFEWSPDIPDPDPYALLHSSEINAGSNYAQYVSQDVDKLLEEGRATNDLGKRKETYHALHKIVHEDEPYTILFVPEAHYAWSHRIHGANPIDISTEPRWPGLAMWSVDGQKDQK